LLHSLPDGTEPLVIATARYIGEASIMRGSIPSSLCYRIYDYVDRQVPMLTRMFEKRLVTFRAIGYDLTV